MPYVTESLPASPPLHGGETGSCPSHHALLGLLIIHTLDYKECVHESHLRTSELFLRIGFEEKARQSLRLTCVEIPVYVMHPVSEAE